MSNSSNLFAERIAQINTLQLGAVLKMCLPVISQTDTSLDWPSV